MDTISVSQSRDGLTMQGAICSLPDDLLQYIFELGYSRDHKGNTFSKTISHVCSRFRAAALHTPTIWSTLSSAQKLDEVEAFLDRSKAVELTISVSRPTNSPLLDLSQFMDITTKESRRWRSFTYRPCDIAERKSHLVLSAYPGLDLPSLRSLSHSNHKLADISYDNGTQAYYVHWVTTNLRHFYGYNALPGKSFGAQLTSCTLFIANVDTHPFSLEFTWSREQAVWRSMDNLMDILREMPRLEDLSFSAGFVNLEIIGTTYPRIALPNLTSLSVMFVDSAITDIPRILFTALDASKLSTLKVTIDNGWDLENNGGDTLLSIITHGNQFPALRCFEYVFKAFERDYWYDNALKTVLARLPSLHDLVIRGSHIRLNPELWTTQGWKGPSLRNITLIECACFSDEAVKRLVDVSRHGVEGDELQQLELIHCVSLSSEYLDPLQEALGDKLRVVL